jgi:hypothetical protein
MIDDSLSLNLVRGQIPAIQSRISKHMNVYQELLLLSCEMFLELYRLKQTSPLIERWHKAVKDLM